MHYLFFCFVYLCLIRLRALLLHHLQKLVEVDGPVAGQIGLHHQLQDLVLGRVLPDRAHHQQQLLGGDRAAAVLE